jgi:hypothetical protein
LLLFEDWLSVQGWIVYLAAIPAYFLLQVFAESALEGLWATGRWVGKAFAIGVLIVFYVVWFWQH